MENIHLAIAQAMLATCKHAASKGRTLDNINVDAVVHSVLIKRPEQRKPRVLVVVQGGEASTFQDEGADVYVTDWDTYNEDPENFVPLPARFKGLGSGFGLPVEGDGNVA